MASLTERVNAILTNRREMYGPPHRNFDDIARMWSVVFGIPVTSRQVALAMICTKIARDLNSPQEDNLLDIAGYADCADQIVHIPRHDTTT